MCSPLFKIELKFREITKPLYLLGGTKLVPSPRIKYLVLEEAINA